MGMRSPKSNWLRFLTLYLLIGLAVLLFVVNLFSPFSSQAGSSLTNPTATTIAKKYLVQTETAVARAAQTANAQATTHAQQTATAIANNPIALVANPVAIKLRLTDVTGLINQSNDAEKRSILTKIEKNAELQGQTVALIVVYIGFVDTPQATDAQSLADSFVNYVFPDLTSSTSSNKGAFVKAVYHTVIYQGTIQTATGNTGTPTGDTLSDATKDLSIVDLRVYTYNQKSP